MEYIIFWGDDKMVINTCPETSIKVTDKKTIALIIIFVLVVVGGLFYVKWSPYYTKAFLAASKHSIGASIISGKSNIVPTFSFAAAISYMAAYFNSVWRAVILALLIGSLVQVAIPKNFIKKLLGEKNIKSTLVGGVVALPSMMCTCCAAPVTVGLRKSSASPNAALAYLLGNPILNPATIIFMGFVLGWNFAIFRILIGLIVVFVVSTFASKLIKDDKINTDLEVFKTEDVEKSGNLFERWIKTLLQLVIDTIPIYIIVVGILGASRAFLFPVISPVWGNSIIAIIGLAIAGTLFVIPTAGEIPIIQTLMMFGLGIGPTATLLIALPAISLPSLLLVKRVFPTRVLVFVGISVAMISIISGFIGMIVLS